MKESMNTPSNSILKALDLPEDLILGLPCISLVGNREIRISNHRGLLSYDECCIVILAKTFEMKLKGSELLITSYSKEELCISGYIESMEFI